MHSPHRIDWNASILGPQKPHVNGPRGKSWANGLSSSRQGPMGSWCCSQRPDHGARVEAGFKKPIFPKGLAGAYLVSPGSLLHGELIDFGAMRRSDMSDRTRSSSPPSPWALGLPHPRPWRLSHLRPALGPSRPHLSPGAGLAYLS